MKVRHLYVDEEAYVYSSIKNNEDAFGTVTDDVFLSTRFYAITTDNDEMLGFFATAEYSPETINLCFLYVNEKERHKGAATFAINWLVERFKDSKEYIYCLCEKDNYVALNYYKARYKFLHHHSLLVDYSDEIAEKLYRNGSCYEVILYKKEEK